MVTCKSSSTAARAGTIPAAAKDKPLTRAPATARRQADKPSKPAAEPVAVKQKAAAPTKPHKQKVGARQFHDPA